MIDPTLILVLGIVFVASLIRSALGFGEALVAVPLLALLMPVDVVAPLAVLISITIAAVIMAQDWHHVHLPSAGRLVLATFPGIPVGLLLLITTPESLVKGLLAIIIIGFSLYCLTSRRQLALVNDRLAWCFGFGAGVLGGAYGMNGPPLVVYGTLRQWSPAHFRATLQGYFLPASIVGMFGYWLADLWVPAVTRYYLLSLAPVLVATVLGRWFSRRLSKEAFLKYVHLGLIAVGLVLLTLAIW